MSLATKKALVESLKDLLAEKPVDKITVSELTEKCGISRMTFYYHFKDIYDLMEYACNTEAKKVLAGNYTYDTWQQGFLQIFEVVKEYKPLIINAYRCLPKGQIETYLDEITYRLLVNVVNETAKNKEVSEKDKAFIANFYKHAFVGIVLDWIGNGMKEEPKDMVDSISKLMQGNFARALDAYLSE